MKINSKTEYNKPYGEYIGPSEYHAGDKVRLVTIDEATRRTEHINNISIYDDVFLDHHTIRIKVDGKEGGICSIKTYESFLSFDELTVTACDPNDKILPLLLSSINDHRIWIHPVFVDKIRS